MSLSKAVVLRRESIEMPIGLLANFDIVSVQRTDFVSSALLLMTKHNKRRLAVKDGERFVGILEEIDLLGFLAGSAQVTAGRIDRASSQQDLAIAAREIEAQTRVLRRQGVKVEVIAEIVSDLNRRLLSRLFEMVAPAGIRSGGCLIVMGSEGRGEQTMRTDQDKRPHPVRACRRRDSSIVPERVLRCAAGFRFSALSRQRHGKQSGMVQAAC
ncbi:signal-transduction protein with cAMP-binding, CBS, and nucleotidyltransferase domain [Bradyrhizobium sp. JR6.1]